MEILEGFTKLNKDTKKAQTLVHNFVMSKYYGLWQIYVKPSKRKEKIYSYWLNYYARFKTSKNFCIPTYNAHIFTIAFTINKNTQLVYITPSNNYIIDLI